MGDGEGGRSGRAALGFRVKSGWAMAVVLARDAGRPRVVERSRVELYDPSVSGSGQPYHEGLDRPAAEARATIARLVTVVEAAASRSVDAFLGRCAELGFHLAEAGLVVGSVADPAAIAND